MVRFLCVFGVLECFWICCYSAGYDNHTLIKFYTMTQDQLLAASQFHDPDGQVQLFKGSRKINDTLDLLVPPNRLQYVEDFAKQNNLTLRTNKYNYGRHFEDIPPEDASRKNTLRYDFNLFAYHSYGEINDYLEGLASKYSRVMKLENWGNSYEGRSLKVASISSDWKANHPIIFVDAGIHAREWIAPAMALYLINRLVSSGNSTHCGDEMSNLDWLILPVVNPDGYEFSRTNSANRMWRKTRSRSSISNFCYGADGNRNYDFKWGVSGSSTDACDHETYQGPAPLSEPETQIVSNIMLKNENRIKLYVSLHSYGQYLVYPWGYTPYEKPDTWEQMHKLAESVSEAVEKAGGMPFTVMTAGDWYPASGASDDYAFGVAKIPYSYTMELTNNYEFMFPAYLLSEALPQYYEGFKTFAAEIQNKYNKNRG